MRPPSLGVRIMCGACSLPAGWLADHWIPRDLASIQVAAELIAHEVLVAMPFASL